MIKNKAIRFGNNVDTDQIIPAKHLCLMDIKDMAEYTFQFDDNFQKHFEKGNIIVACSNFGCGSSREQAPAVLKYRGVSAIIAKDFARIFFRNCINNGIPAIECEDTDRIDNLDEIDIDIDKGFIRNLSKKEVYTIKPFPEFIQGVLAAGGIVPYNKNKVKTD